MQGLAEFREGLQSLMSGNSSRPFVSDGNPLQCRVFIVGINSATLVNTDPWHYWSDDGGFDKSAFMFDYLKTRKLSGARPRIEAIVEQLPSNWSLETNICSVPTKRAADLRPGDRGTAIFQFLFEAIRPDLVFVHSKKPIEFFRRATGCEDFQQAPQTAEWCGHRFALFGRPGPIWTMKIEDARALGRVLASHIWNGPNVEAARTEESANPMVKAFADRFSNVSIKLPWNDLQQRRPGKIATEGWWIQYQFGQDESGEFLDYLAEHRLISGGEHIRIRADGRKEVLPALSSMLPVWDDPIENDQMQAKFNVKQREIAATLKEKGFLQD